MNEVLENPQLQNQFNQALVQKLQEITNELVMTKEHLANTGKKLTEVEGKNSELEVFIEKNLEIRECSTDQYTSIPLLLLCYVVL